MIGPHGAAQDTVGDLTDAHRLSWLDMALDLVSDAVYLLDDQGGVQYANLAAARMLGHDQATLLRMSIWDVDAAMPVDHRHEPWRVLMTQGTFKFETRHRTAHGRQIPVEVLACRADQQGKPHALWRVSDVSGRQRAQQTIAALVAHSSDIVARYDSHCRCVYVNPALVRATEVPEQALLGRRPGEGTGLAPETAEPYEAQVRAAFATGQNTETVLTWCGHGGIPRRVHVRLIAERDAGGEVVSVLAIGRDITGQPRPGETRRELPRRREAAREEERRHIARELHDEMGQHLSALRMEVAMVRRRWGHLDPALSEKTATLQGMVDHVIQATRSLVSSLRPPVLDLGVVAALEWLVGAFRPPSGPACHLHIDRACGALDPQQTAMAFRIVQESLNNIRRHARATRVDVTLKRSKGKFVLVVSDNGVGFDACARPRRSLGLLGIQERAQMLGGALDLRSSPGSGTTICVAFPASAVEAHGRGLTAERG